MVYLREDDRDEEENVDDDPLFSVLYVDNLAVFPAKFQGR
jgi:hypothetical protein